MLENSKLNDENSKLKSRIEALSEEVDLNIDETKRLNKLLVEKAQQGNKAKSSGLNKEETAKDKK